MWQTLSCLDWCPQSPSELQNVLSNCVMGEVMVIGIKTNFNVWGFYRSLLTKLKQTIA